MREELPRGIVIDATFRVGFGRKDLETEILLQVASYLFQALVSFW